MARLAYTGSETQPGTLLGSPVYMSPEQASGREADYRSDIYSLGATLYKMVTGKSLFEGNPVEVIGKVINGSPTPAEELAPKLSEEAKELISSMLAKDPARRPSDLKGAFDALA